MKKRLILGSDNSGAFFRNYQRAGYLNSHVEKSLTKQLCRITSFLKVKKESKLKLYKKETVIRDGRILLIKEAEENEAKELINYISIIGCESKFLTFGDGVHHISIKNEKKFIKKCKESGCHALLVGWLQKEVVGYLAFRSSRWQRMRHMGEFALSVSKKNWSLGIGSKIICSLLDWAGKSKVIKTIEFRVRADNNRAIAVYRKLGFTEDRSFLWNPVGNIVMSLTLP